MRLLLAVLAAALVLAACVTSEQAQRGPVDAADGLQLSGTLAGERISVTDGEPEVHYGDCDPADGRDVDLCIVSFTVEGAPIGLVIENPALITAGERFDLVSPTRAGCQEHCDDVGSGIVAEVRRGADVHVVRSGSLRASEAGPRYAAEVSLDFEEGSLTGAFNVRPPVTP